MKEITPEIIDVLDDISVSVQTIYDDRLYIPLEREFNNHPTLKAELDKLVYLWSVKKGHDPAEPEGLEGIEDDGSLDFPSPTPRFL